MDKPDYAYDTFLRHFNSSGLNDKDNGFTMLELGPGDSIASGVIAHCFGAKKSYLVDKGSDAIASSQNYGLLFDYLNKKFECVDFPKSSDIVKPVEEITDKWNIEYMVDGLDSLKKLEDSSVDYLWSQSVLEHIRKPEFTGYINEFRRLVSKNGVCVHGVDLKDHLSYSHNNLRFSEDVWESEFMANSGFYTNRILFSEMMSVFEVNGFEATAINIKRWDNIPTPRKKLASDFSNVSDEDLLIAEFDVVLRPV
jgi:hypothetical protein